MIKYILQNKIEYLPYLLSPEIWILLILISPVNKLFTFFIYFPLFVYFALRALSKAKKDLLPKKNVYIVFFLPFILVACLFLIINIIAFFVVIIKLITRGNL